ncbi:MAG: hypothetical protein A4E34_02291 [Methanoregula sp. PtaU1.Bin006]|nr:MAG: hypothetical protein A4E33_00600 [Methanoregula sp. PtaB.Bin085]OPY32914.1 MAG: hypothetical protein A4E34_02291 [Methanoregula sp. PtaU1.Bin006]
MSSKLYFLIIFFSIGFLVILTGCIIPEGIQDSIPPENTTALIIGIALNNTTVQSYLTEPWTIADVNMNATTTIAGGGEEIFLKTPDVIIDSRSRSLHVYVDPGNRTVISIWDSPKRVPYP